MTTAKRDTLARYIRRIRSEVYADFVEPRNDLQAAEQAIGVLESRVVVLNRHWDAFCDQHFELASTAMSEEAQEVQDDLMIQIEGCYVDSASVLHQQIKLRRAEEAAGATTGASESTIAPNIVVTHLPNALDDIKLERVHMEKFDGDYTKWLKFRDTFKALVHEKRNVSDAVKLYHLMDNLQPEVKKILDGYAMSAESYAGAWETLLERYDNEWVIVESHLRKFFSLPTMRSENATELHKLIDTTTGMLRSLPALGIQVDQWDPFVVFWIVTCKLDAASKRLWSSEITHKEIPTVSKLIAFLRQRARQLEVEPITQNLANVSIDRRQRIQPKAKIFATAAEVCVMCSRTHNLTTCEKFIALPPKVRFGKAKALNWCYRCLRSNCQADKCEAVVCSLCNKGHHKLLCFSETPAPTRVVTHLVQPSGAESENQEKIVLKARVAEEKTVSMFGTVKLRSISNFSQTLRALIDTGAEVSLITERAVQRLSLPRKRASLTLIGLEGLGSTKSNGIVNIVATSWFESGERIPLRFYVVKKLTRCIPSEKVDLSKWSHFRQLQLADDTCCEPGNVDLIIGVDQWNRLERRELYYSVDGSPAARHTRFGWMIYGAVKCQPNAARIHRVEVVHAPVNDLNKLLERFWSIEETSNKFPRSAIEQRVEDHFESTFKFVNGAYCVNIPFNYKLNEIGASRKGAMSQLLRNERKMSMNSSLREQYTNFMNEYEQMGHMTKQPDVAGDIPHYFIPHHAVVSASKFRVVFNASFPSSTGVSLNDAQLVGEKLQDDLPMLIWKFRAFKFAL